MDKPLTEVQTQKEQLRKEYELVLLGLSEDHESSELFDWMIEKVSQALLSDRARLVEEIETMLVPQEEIDRLYKQGFGTQAKECKEHNGTVNEAISIIKESEVN